MRPQPVSLVLHLLVISQQAQAGPLSFVSRVHRRDNTTSTLDHVSSAKTALVSSSYSTTNTWTGSSMSISDSSFTSTLSDSQMRAQSIVLIPINDLTTTSTEPLLPTIPVSQADPSPTAPDSTSTPSPDPTSTLVPASSSSSVAQSTSTSERPFTTPSATQTPADLTTQPTPASTSSAAPSRITPEIPNPVTVSPASSTAASGNVYQSNLDSARWYNTLFSRFSPDSACSAGQVACLDGKFATCSVSGAPFTLHSCGRSNLRCFVLPLAEADGVVVGCHDLADAESILGAPSPALPSPSSAVALKMATPASDSSTTASTTSDTSSRQTTTEGASHTPSTTSSSTSTSTSTGLASLTSHTQKPHHTGIVLVPLPDDY